jgi:hypothetical protein
MIGLNQAYGRPMSAARSSMPHPFRSLYRGPAKSNGPPPLFAAALFFQTHRTGPASAPGAAGAILKFDHILPVRTIKLDCFGAAILLAHCATVPPQPALTPRQRRAVAAALEPVAAGERADHTSQ